VADVVWTTGFRPDTSWIDLPVFDPAGEPMHRRGVVETRPGIYVLGGCFRTPWRRP
jgi:putative flavoprotein involved in K+ transport